MKNFFIAAAILLFSINVFALSPPNFSFEQDGTDVPFPTNPVNWDINLLASPGIGLGLQECLNAFYSLDGNSGVNTNWESDGFRSYGTNFFGNATTFERCGIAFKNSSIDGVNNVSVSLDFNAVSSITGPCIEQREEFYIYTISPSGSFICDSNKVASFSMADDAGSSKSGHVTLSTCGNSANDFAINRTGIAMAPCGITFVNQGFSYAPNSFSIDNITYINYSAVIHTPTGPIDANTPFDVTADIYLDQNLVTNLTDINFVISSKEFPMTWNGTTYFSHNLGVDANLYTAAVRFKASGRIFDFNTSLTVLPKVSSELCAPVIINGSKSNHIDVVFVGSGFPDSVTFSNTLSDFIDYNGTGNGLMSVAPFNQDNNKTLFNFWKVNSLQTLSAIRAIQNTQLDAFKYVCPFADQLVLLAVEPRFHSYTPVKSRLTESLAFSGFYPAAHVFVGKEYLQDCNSVGGACTHPWPLDITNEDTHPFFSEISPDPNCSGSGDESECFTMGKTKGEVVRTFVHEFGHSFGQLYDEYEHDPNNPDDNSLFNLAPSSNIPNCDGTPICNKWSGVSGASCISDCYYNNWYRAYPNTMMNRHYLIPDGAFKAVNERQLNKQIDKFKVGDIGKSNFSYVVGFVITDGKIQLADLDLVAGAAPNNIDSDTNYQIKLVSSSNAILYDVNFDFPVTIEKILPTNVWDANGVQIGGRNSYETISSVTATTVLPYSNLAKFMRVFDSNSNLIFSKDISEIRPLKFKIGIGGNSVSSIDYNVNYSLLPQSTGKIIDGDYNIILGNN